ncbi:hypothetical protein LCGC14_1549320 [marine sediment metagenome]|uniref:Uncharacterized protein n=1 Tax=marine sediment metagenome TaxID=412755 RepID=A0A0F9IQS6_9ZZZZ
MAARGPKPTATVVKLVTNKPGHRPLPKDEPRPQGPLGKCDLYIRLKGRARTLWRVASGMAWWLGDVDGFKLGVWCSLQAEYERAPERATPAFVGQLRVLGSELGFDVAARTKMGCHGKTAPATKDTYFD